MDQKHFKRPKKRSEPRQSIDGFITPESFRRPSSLGFSGRERLQNEQTNRLDNFDRPDGYHPTNQPLSGTANEQISSILSKDVHRPVLSSEGRHRLKPGEIQTFSDGSEIKKPKVHKWRSILKRTILVLVMLFVIVGGFLGYKFSHNITKVFHGNIFGIFRTTKLKGEDQGRVTILLAGNSADDPGHDGANLTDSIVLVSIDTVHNDSFILSIPRDLWVNFGTNKCSFGNIGKINAVYECGQDTNFNEPGFPKGGMGLLEKDVNQFFGVNINYYGLIDYTAFRDAVNAVGGVNFTVNSDDPRGLYDPSYDYYTHGPLVKLTNGTHVLNGQQALNLARARGDAYGSYGYPQADFNRTQNQRQLLIALKDKGLSVGVLSNPTKVSSLSDAIGSNVQTDFKTDEVRRLYNLSKIISDTSVRSIGLADTNVNLVTTGTIDEQSVVIPRAGVGNYSQIQAFILRLMSNDPVAKEAANVVILNGSGINGLARQKSTVLAGKGITVKSVANTSTPQANTAVIDLNPKLSATKSYLQQSFHVSTVSSAASYPDAQNYQADFIIILGANAANQ
jgi:LCP family protein required for cell wall assembly